MSDLLQLSDTLAVDQRLLIGSNKTVIVKVGPAQNTLQRQSASSLSNNQVVYNVVLNSQENIISDYMYQELTFNVTITATGLGSQTVQSYLQDNFALRQYPIASISATTNIQINNQQCNSQPVQTVHAFAWNQHFLENEASAQSITPIFPDQTQQYNDAVGSGKNPLASYLDGGEHYTEPRGSFNSDFTTTTNGTGTWVFNVTLREPILNSLLSYSPNEYTEGLAYVALFNVTTTFVSNLSRMFSLNAVACPNISSIVCNLTTANLVMEWLTVPLTQKLPPRVLRSFNTIVTNQTNLASVNSGAQVTVQSQTYSFNQIPKKIWIYIADGQTDIVGGYSKTDTFFSIENVSILFNNRANIMANMNSADLYNACMANEGCKMTYMQSRHFVGAVLVIDPVKLFALQADQTSGMLATVQFQCAVTCTNISDHTITNPVLWVNTAYDTVLETTSDAVSNLIQGYITPQTVLASQQLPAHPFNFVETDIYGGGFLDKVKSFGRQALDFIRNNKALSRASALIPHPYAQLASKGFDILGVGDYDGGRATSRRQMRNARRSYGLPM